MQEVLIGAKTTHTALIPKDLTIAPVIGDIVETDLTAQVKHEIFNTFYILKQYFDNVLNFTYDNKKCFLI